MASVFSTLLVLALAVPAAYALSIKPVEKWTDALFFFLSTKFLPAIAALLPVYLIVKDARDARQHLDAGHPLHRDEPADRGLDDALLPAEVPKEILEAAEVDGAGLLTVMAGRRPRSPCPDSPPPR
jgi:sorbitol/mannitol transport system permease protein